MSVRFVIENGVLKKRVGAMLLRLPAFSGAPVYVEVVRGLRDRHGDVHGGAFLRERRIALNCTQREFPRVFVHELFHFVWLRAGNPVRRGFEAALQEECRRGVRGELGWSAEWRKKELKPEDPRLRTRHWREYCCESFCDTAAWLYSGVNGHSEFTLRAHSRKTRAEWFREIIGPNRLRI